MDTGLVGDLLSVIAPSKGEKLLDVGCGNGQLTRMVSKQSPVPIVITGVDRDDEKLPCESDGMITYVLGDVYGLPFETGQFDVVYSNMVFHMTRHPMTAIREMLRVIRPGGRIVLADVDASLSFMPQLPPERKSDEWQLDFFIGRKLPKLLKDVGVTDVEARVSIRIDTSAMEPRTVCYTTESGFVIASGVKR